jgi:AcrR family transcriptional regulator
LSEEQPSQRNVMRLSDRKRITYVRLLQIALDRLADQGFENVVIRDVAKEAGLSPATIYNLFGTKEAFLSAAVELRTQTFIARNPASHKRGLEGIEQTNQNIAEGCIASRGVLRSVAGMLARDTSLFGVRQIYSSFHTRNIEELIARGQLRTGTDADSLAFMMMTSHNASLNTWLSGEFADRYLGIFFDISSYIYLMPHAEEQFLMVLRSHHDAKLAEIRHIDFHSHLELDRAEHGKLDIADLARWALHNDVDLFAPG